MKKSYLVIMTLLAVVLWAAAAQATLVSIVNFSFEDPNVVNANPPWNYGPINGWVSTSDNSGVFYPAGYGITGVDLNQVAWIHLGGTVSQVLTGSTISAGYTYILSALVASLVSTSAATYHVELKAVTPTGDVLLTQATGTYSGQVMTPVSAQYFADTNYIGDTLKIVLENSGTSTEVEYDKIQLNANAVPLPPSILLLGSGLAGLGLLRRKWGSKA